MKDKLLKIFELPGKAKLGILIGTMVLVAGSFYLGTYQASLLELEEVSAENVALREAIAKKTHLLANLSTIEERVAMLDLELDKALQELPNQKELDELLAGISDKAKDSGLEIKLFQPRGEQEKGFYAEVPVNLIVNGTYHEVATFFDEIAHLKRVVNLDQITMTNPTLRENGVTVETSVVVTGYRFLENFIKEREQEMLNREKSSAKDSKRKNRRSR